MAQIKINTEIFVNGKCSITRVSDPTEVDEFNTSTVGILSTHPYFEDIHTIETERYLLTGVEVQQEDFGSNDYNIKYTFTAEDLIVKDDYVPEECKYLIENEMYSDEDNELFHSFNWEEGIDRYNELQETLEEAKNGFDDDDDDEMEDFDDGY